MNRTKDIIIFASIFLVVCLMLVSQASYAGDAGRAQFVIGSVQITSATGQTSVLKKGDTVKEGDTLTTAKAASAQIKMLDGGLIAVRPDTQLKFDSFKFNGTQDGSERSFFSLFKGGFRAITGLIGQVNKSSFRITTAASTIGIRGTDHETFVVTAGSPLAEAAPVGTYNKVNRGETTMTTEKGTISVLPNQMGFVGAADQMPELRPLNIKIFTVTDRPLKESVGNKQEGESAAVDDTGNKETAVEVASSAGNKDDKEVRKSTTSGNAAKNSAATSAESASGKDSDTQPPVQGAHAPARKLADGNGDRIRLDIVPFNKDRKNDPSSTLVSTPSVLAKVINDPVIVLADVINDPVIVLAVVVKDPVTAINWGRWDGGVKVTNRRTGEVTTLAPGAGMPWAAGPKGIAAAQLPVAGANTYTNAVTSSPTVTSSPANSPGNAGTTGSASKGSTKQESTKQGTTFGMQNSGNARANMNSGVKESRK